MKINIFFILFLFLIANSCTKYLEKKTNQNIENFDYDKAYKFDSLRNGDSAYIYYGKALEIFNQNKDKFGQAKCLVAMAKILTAHGDYFKSQDFSFRAKALFNTNDSSQHDHISDNFNNLGIISNNLKYYSEARNYYRSAIKFTKDEYLTTILNLNIANSYKEEKNYIPAIKVYDSILPRAEKLNKMFYTRVLSNLSNVKWLFNKTYNPIPNQIKALELQKEISDLLGQNASYSHLADYFKDKDPKKALLYAKMMYDVAKEAKSTDDELEALQKITYFDSRNFKKNFDRYTSLRDSLQRVRDIDNNKFATIVYGVEETKTQNAENKTQIQRQYFLLGILVLLIVITTIEYKKRQKKLQQEKELEVKNAQLKMSKKVHDVVANGLYHMMIDVQNHPEVDKTKILNDIEKMYEESRDISHENMIEKDFSSHFSKMVASYSSPEQKVLIVGYKEEIWDNLSYHVQSELYYTIRELLINMKKHSQAQLVLLRFEKDNDYLRIKYTDNGKGINDLNTKKGAGIRNMENRIDTIKGDIIFEENPKGGLIAQITIPLNSNYV